MRLLCCGLLLLLLLLLLGSNTSLLFFGSLIPHSRAHTMPTMQTTQTHSRIDALLPTLRTRKPPRAPRTPRILITRTASAAAFCSASRFLCSSLSFFLLLLASASCCSYTACTYAQREHMRSITTAPHKYQNPSFYCFNPHRKKSTR